MTKSIVNARVVAFGDSITAGIGIPEGSPKWTELIQARFNLELINSGVGGNTSSQGLARMEQDVLQHKPDFVTISFGMNDHCLLDSGEARTDIEAYKQNLIQMVQSTREIGTTPLLVTTNYIIEGDASEYYYSRHTPELYTQYGGAQALIDLYMDQMREIAKQYKVDLIDIRKECDNYDPYEFLRTLANDTVKDGVHPHALGAQVYGSTIGDYLEAHYNNPSQ